MSAQQKTCPSCGKKFTPWRGKKFCSEACRKRAENRRLRGDETNSEAMIPDAQNPEKKDQQFQEPSEAVRGDGSLTDRVRRASWTAVNEITDKLDLNGTAIGWTMQIEGKGWFGRVGKEMSFGPTTRIRAREAVEAYLTGVPYDKRDDERSWRGDCGRLVGLTSGPDRDEWKQQSAAWQRLKR